MSYWLRQQFFRDQLPSLRLCAPCGCVRNAAAPWSYWNGSPRSSCDSVPLRHPLPGNHEQIFLNSNCSHPPRWSSDVCPFAYSPTVTPHQFPNAPTHASSRSRFHPRRQRASTPAHPAHRHSKRITTRGPNGASFKRLYRKRPAGHFFLSPEFGRRVTSDTALTFVASYRVAAAAGSIRALYEWPTIRPRFAQARRPVSASHSTGMGRNAFGAVEIRAFAPIAKVLLHPYSMAGSFTFRFSATLRSKSR